MAQSVSATVGKYTLAERLDRGGPGEVYLAQHWRQQVLIRLLTDLPSDTPGFARRFETKIERLADLDHPQIVPIIGFGQQDGVPYLVMPPVVGERLTDRFARNRPRADELADYLRPIAEALDYAHARGVAHGGLQATNALLDSDGALFLADFGVARIDDNSIGEQDLSRGDDIAALARIAYLGLTGEVLDAGGSIVRAVPGAHVLDRALAGSTVDGYDSAGAFVRDLATELANPGGGDGETDGEVAPGPARHAPALPRRAQAFLPRSSAARRVTACWVAAIFVIAIIAVAAVRLLSGLGGDGTITEAPAPSQAAAVPDRAGLPFAFPIDNDLIARRYDEARGLLPDAATDGQLHRFAAECVDPRAGADCLLVYVFYSEQADLMYNYHFKVVEDALIGDFTEPAANDDYRITMSELPWEKNPDWERLLQVSHSQLPPDFAPGGYSAGLVSNAVPLNDGSADWTMVYVERDENKQHLFELVGEAVKKLPQ